MPVDEKHTEAHASQTKEHTPEQESSHGDYNAPAPSTRQGIASIHETDEQPGTAANIFSQGGQNYRTMGRWDTALVLASNQVGLGILTPQGPRRARPPPRSRNHLITRNHILVHRVRTTTILPQAPPRSQHGRHGTRSRRDTPRDHLRHLPPRQDLLHMRLRHRDHLHSPQHALQPRGLHSGLCSRGSHGVLAALSATPIQVRGKNWPPIHGEYPSRGADCYHQPAGIPPKTAPAGWDKTLRLVGRPSLTEGVNAVLKVCYAYAGNVGFVSYMAEMRDPGRDFAPALTLLQVFSVVLYLVTAVAVYCLSGQCTVSPALGSAPAVPAKVAYAVVLPAILSTELVFGHTATKYLYVVAMRATKCTHQLTDSSTRSWATWVVCATVFWIMSFLVANAIPVFDSILAIASATFIAWFTFGISGVFWYHRHWEDKFARRNLPLAVVNALLILQALFMNGVGLWASISQLAAIFHDRQRRIGGAFTCADNSSF
ncbi:hypothetical protein E4U34_002220 [Claviceps purpurea]|nr:hypothetical protein E4U34_002220 [Claviceps purpurea]